MFRSLAVKLTIAFLLVGLTGSILVSLIIQMRTRAAFNNFILSREQIALAENLVYYYQVNGSWEGVVDDLARLQANPPVQPGVVHNPFPEGSSLTLVGPDRTVVYNHNADEIGQKITRNKLNEGVSLSLNNEVIGWLLLSPVRRTFTANTPEGIFLGNLNRATVLSACVE